MGKVVIKIKVGNWSDIESLALGPTTRALRFLETEALVDTGATGLYLKASVIAQLGLRQLIEVGTRDVTSPLPPNRTGGFPASGSPVGECPPVLLQTFHAGLARLARVKAFREINPSSAK